MLRRVVARAADEGWSALRLARAGLLRPMPPHQLAMVGRALHHYGAFGAALALAAARDPDQPGLVDERGTLTFGEIDRRSNALANEWLRSGLRPGCGVGVLARNHRGLVDALFAGTKIGARIVLLNTDFGADQLRDVLAREGAELLVHDEEFSGAVAGVDVAKQRAWADGPGDDTLDALIERGDPSPTPDPGVRPKIVILTSGTSGPPKGATRSVPPSLLPAAGLLDKVPFPAGGVTECATPLFHSLGFGHLMFTLLLASTLVLRRRFDPRQTLESVAAQRASGLVLVPVMLRRLLDAGPADYDLSSLRIIFVAGSQLGGPLCSRAMDEFGPVVYNLYGSTEVAYATIATPDDLAHEPACVGRVVRGAVVKILDDDGREVSAGTTGRIFVGNDVQFEGYTGGGGKEMVHGLMSSGDVGHFDAAGRLFVDGRDDEMIVSGGENVFPAEVEDALSAHADVVEAAVVPVEDDEYGQRLRGFVVLRPGASLSEQDVKDYLRGRLARFKVPREVLFVDELPRNPTGKVLKRQLAQE
ncbi:MAG TPA: AMP-binding protein [Mycobacterium sp.]|nr:AMP-binding protein [Mycobacterium sp.]